MVKKQKDNVKNQIELVKQQIQQDVQEKRGKHGCTTKKCCTSSYREGKRVGFKCKLGKLNCPKMIRRTCTRKFNKNGCSRNRCCEQVHINGKLSSRKCNWSTPLKCPTLRTVKCEKRKTKKCSTKCCFSKWNNGKRIGFRCANYNKCSIKRTSCKIARKNNCHFTRCCTKITKKGKFVSRKCKNSRKVCEIKRRIKYSWKKFGKNGCSGLYKCSFQIKKRKSF